MSQECYRSSCPFHAKSEPICYEYECQQPELLAKWLKEKEPLQTIEIAINKLMLRGNAYIAEVTMENTPYRISGLKTDSIQDLINECEKWHIAANRIN